MKAKNALRFIALITIHLRSLQPAIMRPKILYIAEMFAACFTDMLFSVDIHMAFQPFLWYMSFLTYFTPNIKGKRFVNIFIKTDNWTSSLQLNQVFRFQLTWKYLDLYAIQCGFGLLFEKIIWDHSILHRPSGFRAPRCNELGLVRKWWRTSIRKDHNHVQNSQESSSLRVHFVQDYSSPRHRVFFYASTEVFCF